MKIDQDHNHMIILEYLIIYCLIGEWNHHLWLIFHIKIINCVLGF